MILTPRMTESTPNSMTETTDDAHEQVAQQMSENPEAADVALSAVDELAELSGSVDDLQAEIRDLQEQVLRRAAEFQNYRRRTETELSRARSMGRGEVVLALIDVYDDLKRSLDAAEAAAVDETTGNAYQALNDGVRLVYAKFSNALTQLGVVHIAAVGQPFDEEVHDAMMQQAAPDDDTPSGTVIAEIQPGYKLGDRVLRHAQVIVAQ